MSEKDLLKKYNRVKSNITDRRFQLEKIENENEKISQQIIDIYHKKKANVDKLISLTRNKRRDNLEKLVVEIETFDQSIGNLIKVKKENFVKIKKLKEELTNLQNLLVELLSDLNYPEPLLKQDFKDVFLIPAIIIPKIQKINSGKYMKISNPAEFLKEKEYIRIATNLLLTIFWDSKSLKESDIEWLIKELYIIEKLDIGINLKTFLRDCYGEITGRYYGWSKVSGYEPTTFNNLIYEIYDNLLEKIGSKFNIENMDEYAEIKIKGSNSSLNLKKKWKMDLTKEEREKLSGKDIEEIEEIFRKIGY